MTQFFDYINTIVNSIKDTISSITALIPQIFDFFKDGSGILPQMLKVPFLVVLGLCIALLIYRFLR